MIELISISGRRVFYLRGTQPACFYLADVHAGGVLVNAPPYAPGLRERLDALVPLRFVFLPSALGLRGQRFEFAFCDNYVHRQSRFGPGAADAVRRNLTDRIATAQQPGGLSCRVITPR